LFVCVWCQTNPTKNTRGPTNSDNCSKYAGSPPPEADGVLRRALCRRAGLRGVGAFPRVPASPVPRGVAVVAPRAPPVLGGGVSGRLPPVLLAVVLGRPALPLDRLAPLRGFVGGGLVGGLGRVPSLRLFACCPPPGPPSPRGGWCWPPPLPCVAPPFVGVLWWWAAVAGRFVTRPSGGCRLLPRCHPPVGRLPPLPWCWGLVLPPPCSPVAVLPRGRLALLARACCS